MKDVIVTATFPSDSKLEYGVWDSDLKKFTSHGYLVAVSVGSLSGSDSAAIGGTRTLMQSLAFSDSKAKCLPDGTVTVRVTRPVTTDAYYDVSDGVGNVLVSGERISVEVASLTAPQLSQVVAARNAMHSIAVADATAKGLLP